MLRPDPDPREAILRLLSMDPRLARLVWRERGVPARGYQDGRRLFECEERRRFCPTRTAVAGPDRIRSFSGGEGATLRVEARGSVLWTQGELARLEAAALELASLSRAAPAREAAESAAAARMHDLAHLVAQAQLLLDAEGALDRAGLRACLAECARAFDSAEFAQEPSSGAPTTTRIAELLERETQRALGARRGAESVRVLAQVDCGLETELDPHVLGRLVRNLVLNAIEASAEGGIVRVRAWSSDAVLRLEVRDEGRGLDAKRRARLFGAHGIEARGRGLGTESVRLCALRLGARVAVEGAPGRGLVVTASWDVPRNRAAVALLVDVPATRARIGERLRREGATVLEHEAGRALLRAGLTESVSRWVVGRGAPILATIEGRRLRGRPFEVASLADAHLD